MAAAAAAQRDWYCVLYTLYITEGKLPPPHHSIQFIINGRAPEDCGAGRGVGLQNNDQPRGWGGGVGGVL